MAEIGTDISKATNLLRQGEVVAIPTETVYGLAANALNVNAVKKIFSVKGRPSRNPLIIHVASRKMLEKYVSDVPKKLESLINEYWPGPLTILFDKNSIIPNEVNAGLKKVAVRMPNHETTLELIESLNIPLAAPSANPFGYISPTRADHVQEQLGDKIPYILDGGPSKIGLESTIIGLEGDLLVVYRLGGITLENLMLHYGGIVTVQNHKEDNQDAPGMLPYHYAPKTELILSQDLSLLSFNSDKIGLIHHSTFQPSPSIEHSIFLDSTDDYTQAGRLLYESLYHMDKLGLDLIIVEKFPETGLGRTINDRMIRAAYRRK